MDETLTTVRADEVRPSNIIDINGSRWCVTRREYVGVPTDPRSIVRLTISNVNHVLDVRTVAVPAHYDVERVSA